MGDDSQWEASVPNFKTKVFQKFWFYFYARDRLGDMTFRNGVSYDFVMKVLKFQMYAENKCWHEKNRG